MNLYKIFTGGKVFARPHYVYAESFRVEDEYIIFSGRGTAPLALFKKDAVSCIVAIENEMATGLLDADGNDICEGHIVEVETKEGSRQYEVRWFGGEGNPSYDLYPNDHRGNALKRASEKSKIRIIGKAEEVIT